VRYAYPEAVDLREGYDGLFGVVKQGSSSPWPSTPLARRPGLASSRCGTRRPRRRAQFRGAGRYVVGGRDSHEPSDDALSNRDHDHDDDAQAEHHDGRVALRLARGGASLLLDPLGRLVRALVDV
jgi:hypothetical protein